MHSISHIASGWGSAQGGLTYISPITRHHVIQTSPYFVPTLLYVFPTERIYSIRPEGALRKLGYCAPPHISAFWACRAPRSSRIATKPCIQSFPIVMKPSSTPPCSLAHWGGGDALIHMYPLSRGISRKLVRRFCSDFAHLLLHVFPTHCPNFRPKFHHESVESLQK